jgi:anti-sigma regulatory factor (Ser/Thr protein kinase)
MAELGRNPARIIPAWHEFVHDHEHQDLTVRGIGEPIWPGRSDAEVVECQHHETLLNVAFDGTPAWWLLCPYDASALGGDVLEAARRSHPFLLERDQRWPSGAYESPDTTWHPFRGELPEPSTPPREIAFAVDDLGSLRAYLSDIAEDAGFSEQRREEFVLAVNELATNSLRHAGGRGVLFVWRDGDTLMCEVRDTGRFEEPLVGRRRPKTDDAGGSGLWIVNQVCDLVQIRSGDEGNVVRVHMQVA